VCRNLCHGTKGNIGFKIVHARSDARENEIQLKYNCWFQQETLRLFSPKSDSHSGLRNTLLRPPVLIHPQVAFRVLISMAYSKFALGDGDSDSDWGDLSSECSSDSDDSDDSDCDVFGSRSGVLDITLFPV
jgi:hypothetical protein